jgi:leader peptidase (prepilin peptidase)/N-methyltransferase
LSPFFSYGKVNPVIPFFFFLFGIVIGSFLNVCISRIPEGESIVSPGSRCPRCKTPIKPYDNVPIFGWLWLRGKCRNCALPISPMYPIIEFLTGVLFVLTYYSFGITLPTFKWLFFGCLIIILIVTDLRVRILPDAIVWPGFGIGLVLATRIPPNDSAGSIVVQYLQRTIAPDFLLNQTNPTYVTFINAVLGVLDAVLGAAFGAFLLWAAAAIYKLVRRREGMGMGDVKMMAMVGAFLGLSGAFLTILFGTLLGSIIGVAFIVGLYAFGWKRNVAVRAKRRGLGEVNALHWAIVSQYQIPLGTFLGIAALFVVYALPYLQSLLPR